MALKEFWTSVRVGASLSRPRAMVDSPRVDRESIQRALDGADLWLTARAVAGFDAAEFRELMGEEAAERLRTAVEEFAAIARQIPLDGPATTEQRRAGAARFAEIVERLEFDRYSDPEAYRIGKRIEKELEGRRPAGLVDLRFETGLDHSGSPALWIWTILKDEAFDDRSRIRRLRNSLDDVARAVCPDRWPYIRFRSDTEQEAMERGEYEDEHEEVGTGAER